MGAAHRPAETVAPVASHEPAPATGPGRAAATDHAAVAMEHPGLLGPAAITSLQRTVGNRAVVAVLQRQRGRGAGNAPRRRSPTIDEIAGEIGSSLGGPYADYAAFAATMTNGTFLGHQVRNGVRPEFLVKLRDAETRIDDEYAMSGRRRPQDEGITSVGGFRHAAGPHGWGLAIDIDVARNPYVMHEAGESEIDAQTREVYHRIARFIINSPIRPPRGDPQDSVIPLLITTGGPLTVGGSTGRRDRAGEYFDRLALESEAMKTYFELMNDQARLATFLAGDWTQKHPNEPVPSAAAVTRQMWQDFATLGGAVPRGGPAGVTGFTPPAAVGGGDRPFNPTSAGQQDPGQGFLTIPREVVLGLSQAVSRWGAIDFGRASGDVQHFDDMNGLGAAISAAKRAAQARIDRAAAEAATAATAATAAGGGGTATASPAPAVARAPHVQRRKEPGEGSEEGAIYPQDAGPAPLTHAQRLSGAHWNKIATDRWGGATPNISELESGFASDLQAFMDMLRANNIKPTLTSAFRPKQRSYLFKYCLDVWKKRIAPKDVPAMDGVEIIWDHGNDAASRRAAEDLAHSFGLVGVAAHPSNHNSGLAVDMVMNFKGNPSNTITYTVGKRTVTRTIKVDDEARDGEKNAKKVISNIAGRELSKAGADFGVKRAIDNDIVHWSRSGR